MVTQEKFKNDTSNKVELRETVFLRLSGDLTNTGGDLNLSESRLEVKEAKADKKKRSLLVSNGFANAVSCVPSHVCQQLLSLHRWKMRWWVDGG